MPELPEVETTVCGLKKKVLKRTFLDVWTDFPNLVKKPDSFEKFKERIKNKKIENIWRKGKNIIFDLSENFSLLIHQKLTGHLIYGQWEKTELGWIPKNKKIGEDPMNRFIHLIFWLDNGKQLALSDLRKFAKIELATKSETEEGLKKVGPDFLEISLEDFEKRLKNKKGKIKQILMNQEVISGVGNIYSDEALFLAKIHPLKETSKLVKEDFRAIYLSLKKILETAIKYQGSSVSDYRNIEGEKGGYSRFLKVYRRAGQKCFSCGSPIERLKIGGRSAHFCPKCQKK